MSQNFLRTFSLTASGPSSASTGTTASGQVPTSAAPGVSQISGDVAAQLRAQGIDPATGNPIAPSTSAGGSGPGAAGGTGSGVAGGKTLDLSQLRCRFECVSRTTQELAAANIIVSNVGRSTYSQFGQEYTKITLSCGYEGGPTGIIFSGTITQVEYGEHENNTDTLLRIWARDGDQASNQGVINTTLAKGSTPKDIVDRCLQAFAPFGVTMGQVVGVDLTAQKFSRAYPLAGLAREYMREVATSLGATWNINGGKLNLIAKGVQTPGSPIVLNANTGLVGWPIQTVQGIMVRSLINPAITVDCNIQLDAKSIAQTTVVNANVSQSGDDAILKQNLEALGVNDGVYRVLYIKTTGDSRGRDWYMDLTCIGSFTGVGNINQVNAGLNVAPNAAGIGPS